ncbi:ATP synthase subunit b 1 [Desulfosarcina cetonica]|uniref:F0F1 ATP synthase subunit B family protein n=1 Tax=Desulfosarcina cetonica TaxID=90730 RepID=UPI0006D0A55E|nr:ATP synthase F0 subunit B [Desulfosarcina cetonica]VTR71345.1 ATP synthase subunit b 1 [Desulfosarcina cetonica]
MKVPIISRKRSCVRWIMPLTLIALLLFGSGTLVLASSAEGGHGNEAKGWVATDTYRVMNFAVLFIGLFLVLKKPVAQALGGRIQGIKEQLEELEAKKKAAEAKLAEYNAKMAELDKEAEALLAEYLKQGEDAKDRILKEAELAAEKLKEQASKNIEYEFMQAKATLKEQIVEKALAKAEAMIKQKITSDDQEKLVDEYLEKVVA